MATDSTSFGGVGGVLVKTPRGMVRRLRWAWRMARAGVASSWSSAKDPLPMSSCRSGFMSPVVTIAASSDGSVSSSRK